MKNFILIFIVIISIGCNNSNSIKLKELELKEKELELKEKELNIKESEYKNEIKTNIPNEKKLTKNKKQKKKLRHLFSANGGLIGYFSDGTKVGCPRCDFCKSNIEGMFDAEPMGTYNSDFNPYSEGEIDDWVLVDYKWIVKVPQF